MAIRGTTPDYVLLIPDRDLTTKTVYVTFMQGWHQITKCTGDIGISYDGNNSLIEVSLSQEETLSFKVGAVSVQVKFIGEDGYVEGTEKKNIAMSPTLLERVITYDAGS